MTIVPCSKLWPPDEPTLASVHWDMFAGALHGSPLTRPLLMGFRGAAPGDSVTHQPVHKPAYDDAFVYCAPNSMPMVFRGATHAYQLDSKLSPDVSGDGRGDVGSIRPGTYLLKDSGSQPHPIFLLTMPGGSGRIPCFRDTDHDGVISDAERERSEMLRQGSQVDSTGCYATAVLLHTGFDAPPGAEHRSSISCQTCSLKYLSILRDTARTFDGLIDYVLVNAWDAVAMVEQPPFTDLTSDAPGNIS